MSLEENKNDQVESGEFEDEEEFVEEMSEPEEEIKFLTKMVFLKNKFQIY